MTHLPAAEAVSSGRKTAPQMARSFYISEATASRVAAARHARTAATWGNYEFSALAKGWSKGEPLDQHWPLQEPRLLSGALRLIDEAKVRDKGDLLATEFTMSASDVEGLCALPKGWFSRPPAEVVTLKAEVQPTERSTGAGADAGTEATILPFRPKR